MNHVKYFARTPTGSGSEGPVRRRRPVGLLAAVLLPLIVACGGGDGGDPIEPEPSDTTGNGGTVQRGSLTVTVTADGDAAAAMEILGAPAGRVPEAQVTIQRSGESATLTATAGAEGEATFTELLPGRYRLTALRLLSSDEAEAVAAADAGLAGVNAVGGGGIADVDPPASSAGVGVVAGRRGSLVISEMGDYSPVTGVSGPNFQYSRARYVEVYNNGESTIFLDGKILAQGLWFQEQSAEGDRCGTLRPWRLDPEGIWSERHLRFPGSGREHPLAPGQAKVIASQAIDHDEVFPGLGLPDLNGADFEIVGPGQDVDNPAVPNMIQVGFAATVDAVGSGSVFCTLHATLFLVEDLDLDALPTDRLPLRDPDYRRFPAERILDIASVLSSDPNTEFCEEILHPSLDGSAARLFDSRAVNSVQRRVLATTPEGRAILQRTGTTAADFRRGEMSPGRVP